MAICCCLRDYRGHARAEYGLPCAYHPAAGSPGGIADRGGNRRRAFDNRPGGGAGVAELLLQFPALYHSLRWLCVAYLLWIAWATWQDEIESSADKVQPPNHEMRHFRRGLIVNLLNPKAAVFYVSMLPHFVDPEKAALTQTLTLTLLSVAIATFVHGGIVWLGSRLSYILSDAGRQRKFRKLMAVLLALVAFWFAL